MPKKNLEGVVVSSKPNKTIIVEVECLKHNKKYNKKYKFHKKYKVHDEKNEHKEGEKVLIIETKPKSKEKRWKIVNKKDETKKSQN